MSHQIAFVQKPWRREIRTCAPAPWSLHQRCPSLAFRWEAPEPPPPPTLRRTLHASSSVATLTRCSCPSLQTARSKIMPAQPFGGAKGAARKEEHIVARGELSPAQEHTARSTPVLSTGVRCVTAHFSSPAARSTCNQSLCLPGVFGEPATLTPAAFKEKGPASSSPTAAVWPKHGAGKSVDQTPGHQAFPRSTLARRIRYSGTRAGHGTGLPKAERVCQRKQCACTFAGGAYIFGWWFSCLSLLVQNHSSLRPIPAVIQLVTASDAPDPDHSQDRCTR